MTRALLFVAFLIAAAHSSAEEMARDQRSIFDENGNQLPPEKINSDEVGWKIMNNADGANDEWNGVGAMIADRDHGSCTLTLVEPPGGCALDPNRKAMALTNGHCVGLIKDPGGVLRNEPFSQEVRFNHFIDTQDKEVKTRVSKVIYGSMKDKDLAVVELDATYAQLKGLKVRKIAKSFNGNNLTSVGCPTEGSGGIPIDEDKRFMRKSTCPSQGTSDLLEGGFYWSGFIRVKCSVGHGTSGSSLVDGAGEVAALLNTGLDRADNKGVPCTFNNPCEASPSSAALAEGGMNYGFGVSFLHDCANDKCEFDPAKDKCPLPTESATNTLIGPLVNSPNLSIGLDRSFDNKSTFEAFQVKIGPAGVTDCHNPTGYELAKGVSASTVYETKLPPNSPDGAYVVCVRGKKAGGEWQDFKNAASKGIRLDTKWTAAKVNRNSSGSLRITTDEAHESISSYLYKYARTAAGCRDKSGYKSPTPIDFKGLRPKETSGVVCFRAVDSANNVQPPESATVYNL